MSLCLKALWLLELAASATPITIILVSIVALFVYFSVAVSARGRSLTVHFAVAEVLPLLAGAIAARGADVGITSGFARAVQER